MAIVSAEVVGDKPSTQSWAYEAKEESRAVKWDIQGQKECGTTHPEFKKGNGGEASGRPGSRRSQGQGYVRNQAGSHCWMLQSAVPSLLPPLCPGNINICHLWSLLCPSGVRASGGIQENMPFLETESLSVHKETRVLKECSRGHDSQQPEAGNTAVTTNR